MPDQPIRATCKELSYLTANYYAYSDEDKAYSKGCQSDGIRVDSDSY